MEVSGISRVILTYRMFKPRLREWATDVWSAYASQHDIARAWIEGALKSR
jgi:hypothetical protein